MSSTNISQFVIPDEQPVVRLDASTAFNLLGSQEQLYSHYLSKASWYGGLVVLFQTSPESPNIFRLLMKINSGQELASLKAAALAAGLNEQEVTAYMVYCSAFLANMGNYKGFGDCKFIPNLPEDKLDQLMRASSAWSSDPTVEELWNEVRKPIYSLTDQEKQLGLGSKGITKYFTPNCDLSDSDLVNKFFKVKSVEGYINRVLKSVEAGGKTVYEIRHSAVEEATLLEEDFEGCTFKMTTGDYSPLMARVSENLDQAVKYAANTHEAKMLEEYAKSFRQGSLAAHKDGSRHWIKNKGPLVETYIGFIETYRDPAGMRGEFEGFVSCVNKEMSEKFQVLVDKAEEMLPALPWPKDYEKDTFLRPDFTSLDVLTFAGSGVPAGINIPNYDEIRQDEGFKNVSLGNVLSASYGGTKKYNFMSEADNELFKKYKLDGFEVQVGLHELLGHGSGKLFYEGKFDKNIVNPLTGKPVTSSYGAGETYDSVFTSLGSSYEECRAECVGIHLCLEPGVTEIFGHSGAAAEDIKYINWLSMIHDGLKGLEMFSPAAQDWKQAHSQARFVIMQVMLEAGEDFVTIKECVGVDGKPDILITMDRSMIMTVGQPAIASFLQKLQVYKATADISTAKAMYDKYSDVSEPWASRREIVMARKQPRNILVQANTKLEGEKLELVHYDPSPEGMLQSWVERFTDLVALDADLAKLGAKDAELWA